MSTRAKRPTAESVQQQEPATPPAEGEKLTGWYLDPLLLEVLFWGWGRTVAQLERRRKPDPDKDRKADEALALKAKGMSWKEIKRRTGLTRGAVYQNRRRRAERSQDRPPA
jgi:hypothetical protein